MPQRVTLQDIAEACGTGKSTVARALTGNPHVKQSTRELILSTAERLGYRPDPSFRILSQHRWGNKGSSNLTLALISNPNEKTDSSTTYKHSLHTAAERLGYRLETFKIKDYQSTAKLGRMLYNRGIQGLLIAPVIEEQAWDLDWSLFSVVGCGVGEYRLSIHSVDVSFFSAVRTCWNQCKLRGYKRIGAVLYRQPGPDNNDSLRHAAVLYEQSLLPSGHAHIPIFSGGFHDVEALGRWVKTHEPDAVIALNALASWQIRAMRLRIPQDIGYCVVSMSGDKGEQGLSGCMSQRARIAYTAVNWLDQLIRTNERGLPEVADEILIEPEWVERESLPRRT